MPDRKFPRTVNPYGSIPAARRTPQSGRARKQSRIVRRGKNDEEEDGGVYCDKESEHQDQVDNERDSVACPLASHSRAKGYVKNYFDPGFWWTHSHVFECLIRSPLKPELVEVEGSYGTGVNFLRVLIPLKIRIRAIGKPIQPVSVEPAVFERTEEKLSWN